MTELRLYPTTITGRLLMAGSMFFNTFRVLIFGEVVLRFEKEGEIE